MPLVKYSPEICAIILEAFRENPSIQSAAAKAGIDATTLRLWLQKGEDGDPEYRDFAIEAQEQRRHMKDQIVAALRETALDPMHPQQTKAAHLLLTNLYPSEFAKVSHVVQHKQETAEAYDLGVLPHDELRELRRLLVKVKAARDKPVLELKE